GLLTLGLLAPPVAGPAGAPMALAQDKFTDFLGGDAGFGSPFGQPERDPVSMTARFTPPSGGKPGQLTVEATMDAGSWIYSTTQPPGGPMASRFTITPSPDYEVGEFQAVTPPKAGFDEVFQSNVEKHEGTAVWTAPVTLAAGVNPANVEIRGAMTAQVCTSANCLPPKEFAFV